MKRWCMWCGAELKWDSQQGWVHQDASLDNKHSAKPTKNDWKAAERREERDTKTIAGKFAEALGCIEDALHWLEKVNAEYDPEQHDDIRLNYNSAMDFWLQAEQAEDALKQWLSKLQRIEPLAPKEKFTAQATDATAYTKERSMP